MNLSSLLTSLSGSLKNIYQELYPVTGFSYFYSEQTNKNYKVMVEHIKTLNIYNEEVETYVFNDRMSYDDFNEWCYSLLDACACKNFYHPELIHVMFIDEKNKNMVQKYVYQKDNWLLLRIV